MAAVLFAALSGLSYGASDFTGALATKKNDSSLVTVAMQLVSLLSLVVILVVFTTGQFVAFDLVWGSIAGVGAALGLTTFYRALAMGPMSTAASVTALTSALLPVIAGLLLGEVPGAVTMAGIGLAIPGAVLVSVGGVAARRVSIDLSPRDRVSAVGHVGQTRVLSVLAGFGFGLFFIALSRTSADGGLFPLIGARLASIAVLGSLLSVRRAWAPISRRQWPLLLVGGVLDCAANSFYLFALETGSFTWVAAISSLYPVSTVLLARVVLKEKIAPLQVFGLGLAGLALVLVAIGAN